MVKKVVLLVLGVIALVGGLLAVAGGGTLLAAFGSSGEVRSGSHPVASESRAIVSEVAQFSGLSDAPSWVDRPSALVEATSADDIFVGIGPAADVDSYLAGASIAVVRDFDLSPYRLDLIERSGPAVPGGPTDQAFWVAQDEGTSVSLDWEVRDGDYRLVIMNADASPGVDTSARLGIQVPFLGPLALGILVAGAIWAAVGIVMIVFGFRARGEAPAPAPARPA